MEGKPDIKAVHIYRHVSPEITQVKTKAIIQIIAKALKNAESSNGRTAEFESALQPKKEAYEHGHQDKAILSKSLKN